MKTILISISISWLAFMFPSPCDIEGGWLGIKVFETSREEVEKRLGKPTEEDSGLVRYETNDALFRFYYSAEPCSDSETLTGGFNVKKGIVLQYSVVPKNELRIDELDWKAENYNRIEDQHTRNFVHYFNRRDGIDVEASKTGKEKHEIVTTIDFRRTTEQTAKYGCKSIDAGKK